MNLGQYSPLELSEHEINEEMTEKAKSKSQQRFMGMVDAYKKGEMPDASPAIKKAAKSMTKKEVKDFAKTKHKGLPEHVDESLLSDILHKFLMEEYSTQGGMTNNYDIKNFRMFVRQHPELPQLPWNGVNGGGDIHKNEDVLSMYKDLSYKVYNALPEESTRDSYHWLTNAYTYLKRGDIQNANFSYTKSIQCLVDALSRANINERCDGKHPYCGEKNDIEKAEQNSPDKPMNFTKKQHTIKLTESKLRQLVREQVLKTMLEENEVHQELVNTLGKYTNGKATSEQANKSIMDLANLSNEKKPVNERNNRSFYDYAGEYMQKNGKKLPDDVLTQAAKKNASRFHGRQVRDGKYSYVPQRKDYNNKMGRLNETFDDDMAKMDELAKDDFYATLIQLRNIVREDGIIDASEAIDDYPATYCVYGSEPEYEGKLQQLRNSITRSVIRTLYNYDIILTGENDFNVNIEGSNVPQAAELCVKLQQLSSTPLNESYAQEGNYTHFAVNKQTNKIVNGWDYSDHDNAELRQFARDYFIQDLIDNDLDPTQYTILTRIGCKKRGINPDDDNQWANA